MAFGFILIGAMGGLLAAVIVLVSGYGWLAAFLTYALGGAFIALFTAALFLLQQRIRQHLRDRVGEASALRKS
ncbi:MAG: hypothetical protein P3W90_003790 [Paracoccus sp. (in: a-proteobacteria)]|nr:hypothetical protein [Paracoccus sp. (in: a-proteobacteria)]